MEAGLPPCYWSYAAPCFCVLYNTEKLKDFCPWEVRWKAPFGGNRIPFGALVTFKPSAPRGNLERWDPPGQQGVFAGYKLHPGYEWKGEYLVWELSAFKDADLRGLSSHTQQNIGMPHTTKVCFMPPTGLSFPLKVAYESINKDVFNPLLNDPEVDEDEDAMRARGLPDGEPYPVAGEEDTRGLRPPGCPRCSR